MFAHHWTSKNLTEPPDWVEVTCHLRHVDGHIEITTLSGPRDQSGGKNAMQAIGSSTTYLERYTLLLLLGLAPKGVDTDNHPAMEFIDGDQKAAIIAMMRETNLPFEKFKKRFPYISSVDDLRTQHYKSAIELLQARREEIARREAESPTEANEEESEDHAPEGEAD